jgi:hypothetical protein
LTNECELTDTRPPPESVYEMLEADGIEKFKHVKMLQEEVSWRLSRLYGSILL